MIDWFTALVYNLLLLLFIRGFNFTVHSRFTSKFFLKNIDFAEFLQRYRYRYSDINSWTNSWLALRGLECLSVCLINEHYDGSLCGNGGEGSRVPVKHEICGWIAGLFRNMPPVENFEKFDGTRFSRIRIYRRKGARTLALFVPLSPLLSSSWRLKLMSPD